MRNKETYKSLKLLIIMTFLMIVLGIIVQILDVGQVNSKLAKIENKSDISDMVNDTINDTVNLRDTEKLVASYSPRHEVASEEVVSRYAKSRERELYNSIDEITISKNMDLTVRTNVSREDFITLIAGVKADTSGFFEENAGMIYDVCEKYQLNEIFFCGLISAESGWDIASNHRRTHNYISLMGNSGSLLKFSTVEEGLEKAASTLHTNYLSETGRFYYGKTLEAVRTRFCPVNPGWTNLVYGRMEQII